MHGTISPAATPHPRATSCIRTARHHRGGKCAGRVNGVAILSDVRSLGYQTRRIQHEARLDQADIAEATRRVRMIFP